MMIDQRGSIVQPVYYTGSGGKCANCAYGYDVYVGIHNTDKNVEDVCSKLRPVDVPCSSSKYRAYGNRMFKFVEPE